MKSIVTKFQTLVRTLNYTQIRIIDLDIYKTRVWMKNKMPMVVDEIATLGWDMSNDDTWSENIFINVFMEWYGKRIALFLTPSLLDYKLASRVLKYPKFKEYRKDFSIDVHAVVLLDPNIFLIPEDLDSLYCSFDFNKGYSFIDFSHYDEEDNLEQSYIDDWEFLQLEEDGIEWSNLQIVSVFKDE